jgi:hypothetical protein
MFYYPRLLRRNELLARDGLTEVVPGHTTSERCCPRVRGLEILRGRTSSPVSVLAEREAMTCLISCRPRKEFQSMIKVGVKSDKQHLFRGAADRRNLRFPEADQPLFVIPPIGLHLLYIVVHGKSGCQFLKGWSAGWRMRTPRNHMMYTAWKSKMSTPSNATSFQKTVKPLQSITDDKEQQAPCFFQCCVMTVLLTRRRCNTEGTA